jgi:DMSO reductase anchor subunit
MNPEPERLRMIRLHKAWADRYTLLWFIIVVIVFGFIYAFLREIRAEASDRTDILILLAVMVLTAAIWQAIGLGVARIHMLMAGIDLGKLADAARQTRK